MSASSGVDAPRAAEEPRRRLILSEDLPLTMFVGVATAVVFVLLDLGAEWAVPGLVGSIFLSDVIKNYVANRWSKRKLLAGTALLAFLMSAKSALARAVFRRPDAFTSSAIAGKTTLLGVFLTAMLVSAFTLLFFTGAQAALGQSLRETTFLDFDWKDTPTADDQGTPDSRRVGLRIEKAGGGTGSVRSNPPSLDCDPVCAAEYPSGAVVVLTATAESESTFAGWRGACSGTERCTLTLTEDTRVVADFRRTARSDPLTIELSGGGDGFVTSDPSGLACDPVCTAEFRRGSRIVLAARAAPGSVFVGWRGSQCKGLRPCVVVLTGPTTEIAVFEEVDGETEQLTIRLSGDGDGTVVSDPARIDCDPTCEAEFAQGESVTLTAQAAPGSTFTGWSGGGCSGTQPCVVALDEPTTVEAAFAPTPTATLAVALAGKGEGTVTSRPSGILCEPTCEASFPEGSTVTLIAAAAEGSTFTGWKGGGCSGTDSCVVTMDGPQRVFASFRPTPRTFSLTVSAEEKGGIGTVTSSPGGISCDPACSTSFTEGTEVTLTAVADSDSDFSGWGGDCAGAEGTTCTITMGADRSVTAVFINAVE